MKKLTGIILGALLVAVGAVYILNIFGIADINFSLDGWWTLFIIIPCLNGIFTSKEKILNIIGLIFGILLLLAQQDIINDDMLSKLIVPVIVIMIGIKLIEKSTVRKNKNVCDNANIVSVNSKTTDYSGKEITVAKVAAIFGGAKCNLTDAKIKNGSQVDVLCAFGGADIIVPENVNVKINAFCLFGGISDKRAIKNTDKDADVLNINGFCIFGGADIK